MLIISLSKIWLTSPFRLLHSVLESQWDDVFENYISVFLSFLLPVYLSICIFVYLFKRYLSVFISLSVFPLDQIWLDNVLGKSCLQKKCLTLNNQTNLSFSKEIVFFPRIKHIIKHFFLAHRKLLASIFTPRVIMMVVGGIIVLVAIGVGIAIYVNKK